MRTIQDIEIFIDTARLGTNGERNALLILIGLNTGLRMSDILNLRVQQVRNKNIVQIIEKNSQEKIYIINTTTQIN